MRQKMFKKSVLYLVGIEKGHFTPLFLKVNGMFIKCVTNEQSPSSSERLSESDGG